VTILVSAFVSLTLTPMMSARLLKKSDPAHESWFARKSAYWFERLVEAYSTTLRFVLQHQPTTLLVTVGTLALTIFLFIIIPKGFFPIQDTGVILGITEAPESSSFKAVADRQQQIADVVLKDPDVESLSSFIGVDGTNMTPNVGRIQINLKSRADRSSSASDIIRRLQPQVSQVSGMMLYMQPVQDITVENRVSRTQYQYTLEDTNAKELADYVPKLLDQLQKIPQLRDVASDQSTGSLQASLVVDRNTASRLGVTPQMIDDTLYDAFGQRLVSTIFTQLNQYHVVLEVDPNQQLNPDDLNNIYVHASPGGAPAAAGGGGTGLPQVGAAASTQSGGGGSSSTGSSGTATGALPTIAAGRS
jgi:multidrug efflux pump